MERFNTEIIQSYMREAKISASEFCKRCKISHDVLTKILNNKFNFGINALFKIARVLDIKVCDMFINTN